MAPAAVERLVRNPSFVAPSPPRTGNPQTQAGNDLGGYTKLGDPGYTHIGSSTSIAAAPNANRESARERERDSISQKDQGLPLSWVETDCGQP